MTLLLIYLISIITGMQIIGTYGSSSLSKLNTTEYHTCTYSEFLCLSGECKELSVLCNGVKDCADGSDEYPEICSHRHTRQANDGTNSVTCGRFNSSVGALPHHLPWYAAFLRKDEKNNLNYVCSGVLVSPRVLISAAHCFWNEFKSSPESADRYAVFVGNYERGKLAKISDIQQIKQVHKIHLPPQFRGRVRNYGSDISVITLQSDIQISDRIHPVCIDFENKYDPRFTPGKIGIVGGWDEPANETWQLQIRALNVVDFEECERNMPEGFRPYLTFDKFCAGFLNQIGLCIGDSGTGLYHQFNDGLWYLTGIASVSVSPVPGERCPTRYYFGFTRVSLYFDFIKKVLLETSGIPDGSTPSTNKCNEDKFQCKSSECIDISLSCNGEKNCADGSDETIEVCHSRRCADIYFQCIYGACIPLTKICDGVNNCVDGSDEETSLCKPKNASSAHLPNPNPTNGCKLPEQPADGVFKIISCEDPKKILSDSFAPSGVFLNYSCNPKHELTGASLIACSDDWTPPPPSCKPVMCPALKNPSREIQCSFNGQESNCENVAVLPGTKASVRCKYHYETIPGLETYDILCEENGKWSKELHSCVPKCGVPNPGGLPLIGYGQKANIGVFPWHIGLYRDIGDGEIIPVCGGSLVSPRVVVSAAHCFWQPSGKIFEDMKVVAGKYFYDWNNKTKYVQHLQIKNIALPKNYRGPGRNYANDIGLIILLHEVQINEAVRPICVDYESTFLRYFSPHSTTGNVIGWGLNENQTNSKALNVANLPYIDAEECERNSPTSFSAILTNDKFCAGTKNRTTVCLGDSGGGFAVKFRNDRYYLVGIVSIGPSETCSLYPYATFTNVFHHLSFIKEYALKFL